MSPERFATFSTAYRAGLLKAVQAKPEDYFLDGHSPESYVQKVATKMLTAIECAGRTSAVNAKSAGFRNACKTLGIKHTYSAMDSYLSPEGAQP